MTIINPASDLGKLRLILADWQDIVILPDSVYLQTLVDKNNNLGQCVPVLGAYILGIFSQSTHRRMNAQLEVWGGERYTQYMSYLKLIIKDPSFGLSTMSILPYSGSRVIPNDILQFVADYKKNFYRGTSSQQLYIDALISPNDGSLGGPLGSAGDTGWQIVLNP